jgi:hypothetical protein
MAAFSTTYSSICNLQVSASAAAPCTGYEPSLEDIRENIMVSENMISCFTLAELACIEILQPLMRNTMRRSMVWKEVVRNQVQTLMEISELVEDIAPLRSLVRPLQTYAVKECLPLPPCSLSQASALAKTVQQMKDRASRHLLTGGKVAKVVVVAFRFLKGMTGQGGVAFSEKISTPVFWKESSYSVEDWKMLDVKLAKHQDKLLLSSHIGVEDDDYQFSYDEDPDASQLLLDLSAVSTVVALQMRNVIVNSLALEKGDGLCFRKCSMEKFEGALVKGLTCVLFVHDSVKASGSFGTPSRTANALSLEYCH